MAYAVSHLMSLMRGSVAGVTYLSNQFHQIVMRQRTSPVQPNTAWQVGIRTAFNAAESIWEGLTEAQRDDWRFYALSCVYPGPGGDYNVPGRQLFIGTLALVLYADGISPDTFITDVSAPLIAGWFNPSLVQAGTYSGLSQGIQVDVGIPTGRAALAVVDISIAYNPTRTRFKGPWISSQKTIALAPAAATTFIPIDRAIGTIGQAIFSRTRIFTAAADPGVPEPHSLAFPVHLRHICEAAPAPPLGGSKKKVAKTAS